MTNRTLSFIAACAIVFFGALWLAQCNRPATLNEQLALEILNNSQAVSGYATTLSMNNPNARGKSADGWNCDSVSSLIEANLVSCHKAGRSGVYLKFKEEGLQFVVGQPWGTKQVKNARVLVATAAVNQITAIEKTSPEQATVHYTWAYDAHTPFATEYLKDTIPLNESITAKATMVLEDNQWVIVQ